jgi:hypothetical protein
MAANRTLRTIFDMRKEQEAREKSVTLMSTHSLYVSTNKILIMKLGE